MKKILTLSTLFVALSLVGQNLDPTVKVTGEYKAQVSSEDIPTEPVFLPDSVADFDTRFDYSVFDKPYQGSYEFSPYLLDLRPNKQPLYRNQFLLKAGLGYTLHPSVDAYWVPQIKDSSLNLSVYAHHRSYLGQYKATLDIQSTVVPPLNSPFTREFSKGAFESVTIAGVQGRRDYKNAYLTWDAAYEGIHNGDGNAPELLYFNRGYNKARASVEYFSSARKEGELFYRVGAKGYFGQDNFYTGAKNCLRMGEFAVYGGVGDMFVKQHGFYLDFNMRVYMMGGSSSLVGEQCNAQYFSVTPHYLMNFDKIKMDLGVNLSYVTHDKMTKNFANATQFVYPDIRITFDPWRQWATFYLKVKGGMTMNTYDDLLADNPHFNYGYNQKDYSLLDNTIEAVNLSLGAEGRVASRFSYELKLGYKVMSSAPMELLKVNPHVVGEPFMPGLAYVSYQSFYAGVGMMYKSESFEAQARAKYQGTYNINKNKRDYPVFGLPPFLVDVRLMYNWKQRIYAGVSLEAQGSRKAEYVAAGQNYSYTIKPFYNLGLEAQYKLSTNLTAWLHVDNLLFQEIQRNLFYAQKGAEFSVGVTLNIR